MVWDDGPAAHLLIWSWKRCDRDKLHALVCVCGICDDSWNFWSWRLQPCKRQLIRCWNTLFSVAYFCLNGLQACRNNLKAVSCVHWCALDGSMRGNGDDSSLIFTSQQPHIQEQWACSYTNCNQDWQNRSLHSFCSYSGRLSTRSRIDASRWI